MLLGSNMEKVEKYPAGGSGDMVIAGRVYQFDAYQVLSSQVKSCKSDAEGSWTGSGSDLLEVECELDEDV